VITNETSNRATPSLVSFGDKQRFLGEGAKTLEISNFKNTVGSLKRLAGRQFNDPEVQANEKKFVNARLVQGENEEVSAAVQFLDDQKEYTFTQLCAMFLAKVKQFTSVELGTPVSDCVISCPTWFTDAQRRAILDASQVAGLNCLRLMNDTTASALGYGITKTDLPDASEEGQKPRIVTFVDVGHSSTQVAVVSFVKGKLTILGTSCDRNLGGRDFDQVLTEHYIKEFNKKYKVDIESSAKAVFRLRTGAEKVKKLLSANSTAPFNVECLIDDKDVSAMVNRSDFEDLAKHLMDRLLVPVQAAIENSKVSIDDIHSCELIGGTTRIPMIKESLAKFFGGSLDGPNKLAYTLNQDEAVARGCALQCAILSPVFKVREFSVQDLHSHPVELHWDAAQLPDPKKGEKHVTEMEVFTAHNSVPSSKLLTFVRLLRSKEMGKAGVCDFKVSARYGKDETIPSGTLHHIGEWTIGGIKKYPSCVVKDGDKELYSKATIKVRARLDGNCLIALDQAYQVEEVEVPIEEKETKETKEGEEPEEVEVDKKSKTKKIIRKHDLTVTSHTASASQEVLNQWVASEGELAANDRLVIDTAEKRNALEEYVYDVRGKLSDSWSDYMVESEKEPFMKTLYDTEDWLYGDGENAAKSVYVERLVQLRKVGDPVAQRYQQANERPIAEKEFREYVNNAILDVQAEVLLL
jgi:heat shock protein 4